MVGPDLESRIEGAARCYDTKILIENDERFSDRVYYSMCKYPRVLDGDELLFEHLETLAGAGACQALSLRRAQTAAEDNSSLYPLCAVGDIIRGALPVRPDSHPARRRNQLASH